jgi:hypothetical protein
MVKKMMSETDKREQAERVPVTHHKVLNLFGLLTIENKTDVLAFAAFLLALVSAVYQLTEYLKGPVVRLFHPDYIMIEKRMGPDGSWSISIVAPMSYANMGGVGYTGTVRKEIVRFQLGSKTYEYVWQEFVDTTSKGKDLIENKLTAVHPFPISGGSSESHETRFTPNRQRCPNNDRECLNKNFLSPEDFFNEANKLKQLHFEFTADVFPKKTTLAACVIDIGPYLWSGLATNGWITLPCWQSK